jgi:DNA-binding transcriptional LysR family regulator
MGPIDDMLLFTRLIELKSFSAVAHAEHISRSLVSKRISRL